MPPDGQAGGRGDRKVLRTLRRGGTIGDRSDGQLRSLDLDPEVWAREGTSEINLSVSHSGGRVGQGLIGDVGEAS